MLPLPALTKPFNLSMKLAEQLALKEDVELLPSYLPPYLPRIGKFFSEYILAIVTSVFISTISHAFHILLKNASLQDI
jgi:hypothetical protein